MSDQTDVDKTDLLKDAVNTLLALVHEHRTPGDSDLAAAIADAEAALDLS